MTKEEIQARSAGKRLFGALYAIERFNGDPADVLREAEDRIQSLVGGKSQGARIGIQEAINVLYDLYGR